MRRRRYLAGVVLATAQATLAGCAGDDETPTETERSDAFRTAFVNAIEWKDHEVLDLTVEARVALAYAPAEASESGVEASIRHVARAFYDRVRGGWDVEGLDASVRIDGDLVATWRMERAWIESYLDGDITRDELATKVENSVERHDDTGTGTPGGTASGTPDGTGTATGTGTDT